MLYNIFLPTFNKHICSSNGNLKNKRLLFFMLGTDQVMSILHDDLISAGGEYKILKKF